MRKIKLSLAAAFVFLSLLQPHIAGADPPASESKDKAEASFVAAEDAGYIELIVVDPDGKPIPTAEVEVRSHPKPEWGILVGTFIRKARYGTYIHADAKGRLRLKLPEQKLSHLNLSIRAPGFGPFWAGWSMSEKTEILPARYTAHLDAGQSVGGIVVDAAGEPVEGARVHPSIEYKKRETDESQLGSGWTTKTGKDGRWRADCVPAAMDRLSLEIVHPDFVPTRTSIVTSKYRLKMDETPRENITIDRGITLTGTVTNEDGEPIEDAKVRAVFVNETREAKTDASGVYKMTGCPENTTAVTVTAKSFAPDQLDVEFHDQMNPVDFQLVPGNTIRVRVVDKDGKPEKKARIFFRRWRKDNYGKGLDTVHQYTDENGIWQWQDAPADAIVVDVCPVGKLQIGNQTLIARDEEYVFTSSQQLTIEGMVRDAETKEPIELFRVVPGLKWPGNSNPHWSRRESFDGRRGKFHYKVNRMDADHLIRIEASGYAPLVSRDVAVSEGDVKFKWLLKKAENIEIKIERPDGSAAHGAEVAVGIPGAQIILRNAEFTSTFAQRTKVDKQGLLKLNPESAPFLLVIVDQAGYAQIACDPKQIPDTIRLNAWAAVEGTMLWGSEPAREVVLVYAPTETVSLPQVRAASWDYSATTDNDGRFRFARVLPGKGTLARQIRSHKTDHGLRTHWSHSQTVNLEAGKKLELQLGGGRSVIGRAVASNKIRDRLDWGFAVFVAQPKLGEPPAIPYPPNLAEDEKEAWAKIWLQTPLGAQWTELQQQYNRRRFGRSRYVTAIGKEGNFRLDDLPAGKYEFELLVENRPAQRFGRSRVIASCEGKFEIPKIDSEAKPLELGELVVNPK